ncbi:hypothetical protein AAMO2058_001091700 [Amorphochlora amoebiformis]
METSMEPWNNIAAGPRPGHMLAKLPNSLPTSRTYIYPFQINTSPGSVLTTLRPIYARGAFCTHARYYTPRPLARFHPVSKQPASYAYRALQEFFRCIPPRGFAPVEGQCRPGNYHLETIYRQIWPPEVVKKEKLDISDPVMHFADFGPI